MLKCRLIFISLFCFAFTGLLANVNFEEGDSIQLKGKVFHANKKVNNSNIAVYIDNNKYKTLDLKASKVRTKIPLNAILTVEISAPGYFLKRFIIDTHIAAGDKDKNLKYKFDMDLFSEAELAGVNTSILDFPIGLVSYRNGGFINDEKYTHQMKMESFRLLEDAKMADRNKIANAK